MKTTGKISFAAAVTLGFLTAYAFAQQNTDAPEKPSSPPNVSGTPVHPDKDRGTTGWTGGARQPGQEPQNAAQSKNPDTSSKTNDPGAAENQPWMATGVDLNGPPKQFRANETPE